MDATMQRRKFVAGATVGAAALAGASVMTHAQAEAAPAGDTAAANAAPTAPLSGYQRPWAYTADDVAQFMNAPHVDNQIGINFAWLADEDAIRELLPPHLNFVAPVCLGYIMQLREADFGAPYNELNIAVLGEHDGTVAPYALSLMLQGPGAECGQICGGQLCPIPKKIADKVDIRRAGDHVSCKVVRHGVKIFDMQIELGEYNDPDMGANFLGDGSNLGEWGGGTQWYHRYEMNMNEGGDVEFSGTRLMGLTCATRVTSFTPGKIVSLDLASTDDDPYEDLAMVAPVGVSWAISENVVMESSKIYADLDPNETVPYLLSYYDRCLAGGGASDLNIR